MFGRLLLLCILLRIPSTVTFFFFREKLTYCYEVFEHERGSSWQSYLYTAVQLSLLY